METGSDDNFLFLDSIQNIFYFRACHLHLSVWRVKPVVCNKSKCDEQPTGSGQRPEKAAGPPCVHTTRHWCLFCPIRDKTRVVLQQIARSSLSPNFEKYKSCGCTLLPSSCSVYNLRGFHIPLMLRNPSFKQKSRGQRSGGRPTVPLISAETRNTDYMGLNFIYMQPKRPSSSPEQSR